MAILVVGGAGYVGSHMVKRLVEGGEDVVVLDNFSTGHRDAVIGGKLEVGDFGDRQVLSRVLDHHAIDVVMLFASFIEVGESVRAPAKYYRNNVASSFVLIEEMLKRNISHFVFSSSAAVYGDVGREAITEDCSCWPVTPYGRTKWMVEQALEDCQSNQDLTFISLRYFNAAGADPTGRLGERHDPETHLIPLVLQTASGRRDAIKIFGRDYPTPDGTCVRDYVHVQDLCEAHLLAIQRLRAGGKGGFYNLGNAKGYSVRQVIETARWVTSRDIHVEDAGRRLGDPAFLVADAARARRDLGWEPKYSDLHVIIEHAWKWELQKGRLW